MEKRLIGLGLGAGALAGILTYGFARIQIAPLIDVAIGMEGAHTHGPGAEAHEHEPEVFSRAIQENIGAAVGSVMFAVIMGALFAVALAVLLNMLRNRRLPADPRTVAALTAAGAFCVVSAVPLLTYPASPPGVGDDATVGARTTAYLVVITGSVAIACAALAVGLALRTRIGGWPSAVAAAIGYLVAVTLLVSALPSFDETPHGFPADVLADFRLASLTNQALLWLVIGSTFACLLPRALRTVTPEEYLRAHR